MYVSLKDVAARSGVSFQTASKVLNGNTGVVSEATRGRILTAAGDLGYVPNALARGLVRRASLTVGVLVDDVSDPALSRFVLAAERTVAARGHVTLTAGADRTAGAGAPVRKLLEHRVDGLLVIAPSLEDVAELGTALRGPLPAVSVTHVPGGGVPVVGSDHAATGALAARHLIALGHERIGTVTGPRRRRVVRSRSRGFRAVLADAGVDLPPERVVEADWTYAGGYDGVRRLLAAEPALTAVFVHCDVMAVGAMSALRDAGIEVPAVLSVVGCDDMGFSAYLGPPLTTVRVPFEETGERAATLLLAAIAGARPPRRQLLPVHLVERGSTAPPGSTAPLGPTVLPGSTATSGPTPTSAPGRAGTTLHARGGPAGAAPPAPARAGRPPRTGTPAPTTPTAEEPACTVPR